MNRPLITFVISGVMLTSVLSCEKTGLTTHVDTHSPNQQTSDEVRPNLAGGHFNATYIDTIHYATPQLYIFNGIQYARYDVLTNTYKGINTIANGYPGVPFTSFDASYVDIWHYGNTAQLYIFSGDQYARYDMTTNQYKGVNSIADGYPGVPFTSIDASYVDVYGYPGHPKLYLFSNSQYARYDILTNTYEGVASINNYPGMPFTRIDAAYIDKYHYNGQPQLYIFSGNQYARWDVLTNTYQGTNTTANGYPGVPF
ncbi:hypothetical protein ACDQ55_14065 [Chitinophaga sp. 30R24]|uniref:hypothetical protein n=1 Tax=Chitinophaga sp. 30R24 TaxID=3248838 RepID=UPI003B907127